MDVTDFCQDGTNHLAVIVWHYKQASSAYSPQMAGLIYELRAETDADAVPAVLAYSSADTLCRQSHAYRTGMKKIITGQMGFSFSYDANKEDGWMSGAGRDFTKAIPVEKSYELISRPNQKLTLQDRCSSSLIFSGLRNEEYCYLFDLKQEEVGFLELELFSEAAQPLLIAYSEHLYDPTAEKPHILNVTPLLPLAFDTALHVPRLIGGRDFSVEYQAKPGHNLYRNPFRRLGGRYLEIRCKAPLQISYAGIRPTMYPLKRTAFVPSGETDRRIYEICVRTLELCLHEHYEDCPWREQCFYAMNSRNQMLCGAADSDTAVHIAAQMTQHPECFVPASLSMKCFPYDALLMADRQTYGPRVLDQIRKQYQIMLDAGSTTVWEDEEGASAFGDAGSLCHGWSAMPVYYYYILRDLL